MADDIVTRLREMFGDDDRCIWCGKHMDSESGPHRDPCDLMEAADEIEQLQMEIARLDLLSKFLQAEFNAMHKEDWARRCD